MSNSGAAPHSDLPISDGPERSPGLETLGWLVRDPIARLEEYASRYGDPVRFAIWGPREGNTQGAFAMPLEVKNVYLFRGADSFRDIFQVKADELDGGAGYDFIVPYLGEHSLFVLDGPKHRFHRNVLSPLFNGASMKQLSMVASSVARSEMTYWSPRKPFSLLPALQKIVADVICAAVFGCSRKEHYFAFEKTLIVASAMVSSSMLFFPVLRHDFGAWSPGGKIRRYINEARTFIRQEILCCRSGVGADSSSMLSKLLKNGSAADRLSDSEIEDEVLTLLVGGYESTAVAAAWAAYRIFTNPSVLAKLREELRDMGTDAQRSDAADLCFLESVCKETLRLHPAVPIVIRRARSRINIQGTIIEKGSYVLPCIHLAHQNHHTFPDPQTFSPERFKQKNYSVFEYLPFGGGVRRCIGHAFAETEIRAIVAELVRKFDVRIEDPPPIRASRYNITLAPRGGLKVSVCRRTDST